jgi:lycopene cyclase domain-containing protein
MPEYTVAAALACVGVVAYELSYAHTGVFSNRVYWITMAISGFFMILVDGWLTKLSAPIVLYNPDAKSPWRFPWDIPIEDFLFAFALLTLVLIGWIRAGAAEKPTDD